MPLHPVVGNYAKLRMEDDPERQRRMLVLVGERATARSDCLRCRTFAEAASRAGLSGAGLEEQWPCAGFQDPRGRRNLGSWAAIREILADTRE